MIDRSTIEKILDTARIEEVIGEFVSLKRRGSNFMACCPFHHEKTPSFSVSPSKGIYKCFGCGKAGNVVNFIMEHEQLTYVEALKYLGNKYHITVAEQEDNPEEAAKRRRNESMLLVNAYAQEYYSKILWTTPQGQAAGLSYFRERGFTDATIRSFRLGYAPAERDAFCRQALKDGYQSEFLTATGLGIAPETSRPDSQVQASALKDRFSDRVMFPILSISGRVIGFGGRTLRTDKHLAKYLNSPESEIYKKSRTLYGIYAAKQSIIRLQKCYLVEGYTDVISFHQAGITNTVASSGTSLTTDQVRMLRRFTPRVTVLYDGDAAGIKASIRGIDMLLEEGLQVKVVRFPDEHDPDSFARSHSATETQEFLNQKEEDFIKFKIELMADDMARDPMARAQVIRDVIQSVSVVSDAITRQVYIEQCSQLLAMEEGVITREVSRRRRQKFTTGKDFPQQEDGSQWQPPVQQRKEVPVATVNQVDVVEKDLLYYLLKFGRSAFVTQDWDAAMNYRVMDYISTELEEDDLEIQTPLYKMVYDEYMQLTDPDDEHCQRYFLNHQNPQVARLAMDFFYEDQPITIKQYRDSLEPEEMHLAQWVSKAVLVFKFHQASLGCEKLQELIKQAQTDKDEGMVQVLLEQLNSFLMIRNTFARELKRLTC